MFPRFLSHSSKILRSFEQSPSLNNSRYAGFRFFADESETKEDTKSEKLAITENKAPLPVSTSFFDGTPKKTVGAHVDRDKRSHRVGITGVSEGVAGEKAFEFVDPKAAYFPTMETLKEVFGGAVYTELPEIRIYLSKNNTKVSAVDYKGNVIFYTSASMEGFKNCKKKSEVAGQAVGVSAGNKCMRRGLTYVRVQLSGLGPGRMSCIQGMSSVGVNIVSLCDLTPLPEFGPRPRKARRL